MSKLTPFGAALRKLRIDHEMRLFDLAEKIGKSTALLSAIETGRKQIPDGFMADIVRVMSLTPAEHKELRAAKDKTKKEVNVGHLAADERELVAAFARNSGEISPDLLEQIRKAVLKSGDGEIPFKRKRRGMLVPPTSGPKLEKLAGNVRAVFGCVDKAMIPIIEIVEFGLTKLAPGYVFDVQDRAAMGNDEGRVIPGRNTLILRQDVYDDACRNGGRGRFTAAHELGHYLMHHGVALARSASANDPIYCDAEWQADAFAGYLMMPRNLAVQFATPEAASEAFGASSHAARVMLAKYNK
jgi:transcriptional regulator with XRE-family HTH domain